jgi:hypothetical protein
MGVGGVTEKVYSFWEGAMNAKPILSFLMVSVFLFAPSAFASFASANATAQYGSLPVDSETDSTVSPALPAEAHALSEFLPGDYGQSDAKAYLDGRVESYTSGSGAYGNPVYAQSYATSSAEWLIQSDTLASGTSVRVWLDVLFEGQLYSEGTSFISSAEVLLSLNGDEIYSGSASFAKPNLTVEGFWNGNVFPNGGDAYDVYAPGTLIFDTAVGEIINLTLYLRTEVDCGPTWETGALADFSNSGSYSFIGGFDLHMPPRQLDVNFILIPEPATLLLLLAGTLLLKKRV